jgi:hypothetical protein
MEVLPLALPQIDITTVDTLLREANRPSLKRMLDEKGIKATSHKAGPLALMPQHLYYVFGVRLQQAQVDGLDLGSLNIEVLAIDYVSKNLILSATLDTWTAFVAAGMSRSAMPAQRELTTMIYRIFRGAGVTSPWRDYGTESLTDGTLILTRN